MDNCLDANVCIEAHRSYYAFDVAPAFWDALARWADSNIIGSPVPVYDELAGLSDALARWTNELKDTLFTDVEERVVAAYEKIADMVVGFYEPQHVQTFLSGADRWVVACAKTYSPSVVTMESRKNEQLRRASGFIQGKIKIPNVCDKVTVRCINTFDLLRRLGWRFR